MDEQNEDKNIESGVEVPTETESPEIPAETVETAPENTEETESE